MDSNLESIICFYLQGNLGITYVNEIETNLFPVLKLINYQMHTYFDKIRKVITQYDDKIYNPSTGIQKVRDNYVLSIIVQIRDIDNINNFVDYMEKYIPYDYEVKKSQFFYVINYKSEDINNFVKEFRNKLINKVKNMPYESYVEKEDWDKAVKAYIKYLEEN